MKKIFLLPLVVISCMLLVTNCNRSDNITFEEEVLPSLVDNTGFPVYFTMGDSLLRANLQAQELIFRSPGGGMLKQPKINYQRDKVAFIDMNGSVPVVVDMEGNLIERISAFDKASNICWSPDGNSLVIIRNLSGSTTPPSNQEMAVWGAPYDPPFDRSILDDPDTYLDYLTISHGNYAAWGLSEKRTPSSSETLGTAYRDGPNGQLVIRSVFWNNRVRSLSFCKNTEELSLTFRRTINSNQSWTNARLSIEATTLEEAKELFRFTGDEIAISNNEGSLTLITRANGSNNSFRNTLTILVDSTRDFTEYYDSIDTSPIEADIK